MMSMVQMILSSFQLLLIMLPTSQQLPEYIKLAALFDAKSGQQEAAFQRAIEMVNDDRTVLTRSLLSLALAHYPTDDSFKASKKLCELLAPGVAAIFGPSSPVSANHVMSVSEA